MRSGAAKRSFAPSSFNNAAAKTDGANERVGLRRCRSDQALKLTMHVCRCLDLPPVTCYTAAAAACHWPCTVQRLLQRAAVAKRTKNTHFAADCAVCVRSRVQTAWQTHRGTLWQQHNVPSTVAPQHVARQSSMTTLHARATKKKKVIHCWLARPSSYDIVSVRLSSTLIQKKTSACHCY
jgi:hypothetical protein